MRLPNMIFDNTLRRPRALFAIGLITLCMTLILSYERIKYSAFSLFEELVPENEELDTPAPAVNIVPLTDEEREDYKSLFEELAPMSYGTTKRPPMKGMPKRMVDTLPEEFVPAIAANAVDGSGGARRLVIVGDVHGQKKALEDLLAKVGFDNDGGDHLVLVGDLVNKGPDSAGVVALAMELGAHAVRGNHEDRVLLAHAAIKKHEKSSSKNKLARAATPDIEDVNAVLETFQIKDVEDSDGAGKQAATAAYLAGEAKLAKGDQADRQTARSLSAEQIAWLADLPLVLRVGTIPRDSGDGDGDGQKKMTLENVVVCHAGLVPGVALEDQDPWAVMNMRTISYPAVELRRNKLRGFLEEQAEAGGVRGALAALQGVDDELIDREMERITASGLGVDSREEDAPLPSSGRDGTYWYEEWSRFQEKLGKKQAKKDKKKNKKDKKKGKDGEDEELEAQQITTVVYGHDAKSGLRVPKEYGKGKKGYTFGLDSGCVYGRSLTALVIEVKKGEAAYEIVQLDCDKAADAKED